MNNPEKNKRVIKRFIEEAFEKFHSDAMDELLTPDFHAHPWASFGIPDGPEGMKQILLVFETAFSKAKVSVRDIIAEADKVVVRYTFEADHIGDLIGIGATGKRVFIPGILIARIEDGKLTEYWREEDLWGLMQQLEVIPTPAVSVKVNQLFT